MTSLVKIYRFCLHTLSVMIPQDLGSALTKLINLMYNVI